MKKEILDILFIKNTKVNRSLFNNLYYSYDDDSFAGFDTKILIKNQIYSSYEILKSRHTKIAEEHNEYKYFVKLSDRRVFIRIVSDYDDIVYDIMIYNISSDEMYIKFDNIFFPNLLIIPESLKDINKTILYIDNGHINIVKNEGLFVSYLGYEDWDYKNKCLNMLDVSIIDSNPFDDFKNKGFIKNYKFKMNGTSTINLKLDIKYKEGFYYIDDIKR